MAESYAGADGRSESEETGSASSGLPDPAEYNPFLAQVELEAVDVVELAATRHALGQSDAVVFEVEGGHQTVDGELFVRFELRAKASRESPEESELVADVRVAIVLRFTIGELQPSDAVRARFLETTATLVAQPYLRENLSALTARLGLEGISLPLARLHPPARTD